MKAKPAVGIIVIIMLALISCEDKISPTLENAAPILSVDAWVTNLPGPQIIRLSQTQPYFDNTLPPGVSGAVVQVTDNNGVVYLFQEDDKEVGLYRWTPVATEVFGVIGNSYRLSIQTNGETFESTSHLSRVPVIDSITFDKEKRISSNDSLVRAEFWSTDAVGRGDAYWIRAFKNGVLLNKPGEINVAFDAGFSAGGETDGVTFITPIRRGINSSDQDSKGDLLSPFSDGDSVNVQIQSISPAAFDYLNQLKIQTDRPGGFQELFATPLANVSTNIMNTNSNGSKVVGFFNAAAVASMGKRYKK